MSRARGIVVLLLLLLALPASGLAQADADSTDAGETTFIPLPVVFYTPETELGLGAIAIYYFRAVDRGAATHPSTLTPGVIFTTKKQLVARLGADIYLRRWRVGGELGFSRFPNTFWGVGNDAPDEAEEDYTPRTVDVQLEWLRRVGLHWYGGLTAVAAYRELIEVEEGGLLDTGAVPGARDGRVVSVGVILSRDSRDSSTFPRAGGRYELRWAVYDGVLGSDYDFTSASFDFRRYVSTFGRHVLAMRAQGAVIGGVAPFDLLPELGGDKVLRGYFGGRYRDDTLVTLQAEYRLPLKWRLGLAVFAGVGQVAPSPSELRSDAFHASGGLGLRFLLSANESLNIRMDRGVGEGGASGFYLSLGEAY